MATITKPMALDETLHTTEDTPRRQADVLAGIQQAIREGFGQVASGIEYDNTTSGLTSDNVQGAVDEVKASLDVVEDDIVSTQEVTGNPLTLTDAAPINAEKLEVVLEPKQDLHGQSYPYVGGTGYNKLNYDVWKTVSTVRGTAVWENNGVTLTATSDDCYTYYNPFPSDAIMSVSQGDIVILSWEETTNKSGTVYLFNQNGDALVFQNNNVGKRISYTVGSGVTGILFRFGVLSSGETISYKNIMLQRNTSEEIFAPYSNICPISGYDEVEVDVVGVNQWDEEWRNGYYNTDGSFTSYSGNVANKNPIKVDGLQEIYFKSLSGNYGRICFYDDNMVFISTTVKQSKDFTISVPTNAYYMNFDMVGTYGTTYNNDLSINYPSTDHDYHAYQSTTASITFGQTVYGGKVDFVSGGTKKTRVAVLMSSLSWTVGAYGQYTTQISDIKPVSDSSVKSSLMCSIAETVSYNNRGSGTNTHISQYDGDRIDVRNIGDNTFNDLIVGQYIVYELATPTTLTTPIAPLKLLDGINNISTNGTTINLGYQQNNVVGELKWEIEQAFYNHAMIYSIQSELAAVNMAYTDDYKGVVCEVPFVQEQRDYSTTPPTYWNIDLSACDIAVNGFVCVYEDSGGMFIENYKVIPTIETVRKDDGCFKVGIGFYNVKMTSAADNITNAYLILDITAFGKVLDLRTLYN